MADEKRTTQPVSLEKRDAATVAAVVTAGASVVSAAGCLAHQSGKAKPPLAPPKREQRPLAASSAHSCPVVEPPPT
jgi:hypothetical protein